MGAEDQLDNDQLDNESVDNDSVGDDRKTGDGTTSMSEEREHHMGQHVGQTAVCIAEPNRHQFGAVRSRTTRSGGFRIWLAIVLSVAGVSAAVAATPFAGRAAVAGAASVCAANGNGGCLVTLPCPVGQTTCPTIDVSPNTNMNDGQFAYVTAKNLPAGHFLRVAFCSSATTSTDPSCLTGNWASQSLTPTTVPVVANDTNQNLTSISYPVFYDPAGQGNSLIPAHDLINANGTQPGFNCDSASNPCALVVTDETATEGLGNGPVITPENSAVVPIGYAPESSGCPSTAPQLQVSSSFSVEHFLPAAVKATCAGPAGVVALNTANDNTSALGDFVNGSSTVSFIDSASDPSQLASLLGKGYAFIPVALSGTVESFLAGASHQGQNYPINSYNLTPNMVAGLVTSLYFVPNGSTTPPPKPKFTLSDNLMSALQAASPPVTCAVLAGCPSTKGNAKQVDYERRYNSFNLLNRVPADSFGPVSFGSFNANVSSGSSYQATNWLCAAPNTPFAVTVDENSTPPGGAPVRTSVTVKDANTAPTTLTTAPLGGSIPWPPYQGAKWVYPDCHGYSVLPALAVTANNYSPAQSPALQAKAMRSYCYGGGVLPQPTSPENPCAGFGLMDSSEAQFFGLGTASVENAAGTFVTPNAASLQAAAAALTPCGDHDLSCPAGTYSVNYGNNDPAAYPMANLTYAVVPTSTLPYATATAVKNLLTNLVGFSHSTAVPAGYAPLPDAIYQSAVADIAVAVHSEPAPPPTTTTTTTSPATTATSAPPSSPSSASSTSGSTGDGGTSGFSTSGLTTALGSNTLPNTDSGVTPTDGSASGPSAVDAPPAVIPTGFLLVGLAASTRFLLPAIVLLALGSLVGGALLLFGPGAEVRRRRNDGEVV